MFKLVLLVHTGTQYNSTNTHTRAHKHTPYYAERKGKRKDLVVEVTVAKKENGGCAQVSQDQNMSAMLVSEL